MPDFTYKRGDTRPPLDVTLTPRAAANLSTVATVKLHLKSGGTVITRNCSIVNATTNQVRYTPVAPDLDVAGTYQAEFELTWNDGGIETLPNEGYLEVEIKGDLA